MAHGVRCVLHRRRLLWIAVLVLTVVASVRSEAGGPLPTFVRALRGAPSFSLPAHAAVDAAGNLYVSDAFADRMQKFSSAGVHLGGVGLTGTARGQFMTPTRIDDRRRQQLVRCRSEQPPHPEIHRHGRFVRARGFGGLGNGEFVYPEAVAVNPVGNVFVADYGNDRIQKFSSTGVFLTASGSAGTYHGSESHVAFGSWVWPGEVAQDVRTGRQP